MEEALRVYAGLSKARLQEFAEEKYKNREVQLIATLRSLLARKRNEGAEAKLKAHLDDTLEAADIELSGLQKRSVEDQMLLLFDDFINAPDDEKDDVYSKGEDRIVFSIFDPHHKTELMKGTA